MIWNFLTKRIISTTYLIIFILMFFNLTVMHETVHVKINEQYGIESEIHYQFLNFDNPAYITYPGCDNELCDLAHNQNEIFGYQIQPFLMLIGFGFYGILILLEEVIYGKRYRFEVEY